MTNKIYSSEKDKQFIDDSSSFILRMVFGTADINNISAMQKLLDKHVKKIEIVPYGKETKDINVNVPGKCKCSENCEIEIIMYGYTGAPASENKFTEHEGAHEFCHAVANILAYLNNRRIIKDGIVKINGIEKNIAIARDNVAGMIKERNAKTGELVGQGFYGKMFNETMMDIISAMSINNYGPDVTSVTVDDVLKKNYRHTGNEQTGYTIFTTITRLMIAAFSNVFINNFSYQNLVNNGASMLTANVRLSDGNVVRANDFLYGIMFDPLHIEQIYDFYMGTDSYRKLCEKLDKMFIEFTNGKKQINSNDVKDVMNKVSDFCNIKCQAYINSGKISNQGLAVMVDNYNKIWNEMQLEYGAYFSGQEINDIYRRANMS